MITSRHPSAPLPETINLFLERSRVATVCFSDNQRLHAINCFFAHDPAAKLLIMKSTKGSGHDNFVHSGCVVAGTILPDMISLSGLRGLQFRGNTMSHGLLDSGYAANLYNEKFQFSRFLPGYVWAVELVFAKFTDNRVRFGHKVTWPQADSR